MQTFPGTAVRLDPHTDGAGMTTVWHELQLPGDDGRVHLPHLHRVRVTVPSENLQRNKINIFFNAKFLLIIQHKQIGKILTMKSPAVR